jgi:hypothetical protein
MSHALHLFLLIMVFRCNVLLGLMMSIAFFVDMVFACGFGVLHVMIPFCLFACTGEARWRGWWRGV